MMMTAMPEYQSNLFMSQPPNFYSAVDNSDLTTKIGPPLKQMSRPIPPRSESVDSEGSPKAKNRLYKTELCRSFAEYRRCPYGERCQYAHGDAEVRNLNRHPKFKTELCRTFHNSGYCPYGPRCHFVHSTDGAAAAKPAAPQAKMSLSLTLPNLLCYSSDDAYGSSIGSDSPTSSYSPGLTDDDSAFMSPIGPPMQWSTCEAPHIDIFNNNVSAATDSNMIDLITARLSRISAPAPAPINRRLPVFTRLSNGE